MIKVKKDYVAPDSQLFLLFVKEDVLQTSTWESGFIDSVSNDDTWDL